MPSYNFKKGTKLYVVYSGNQYMFELNDITISQTLTEESYQVRTLHSPNSLFDGGVINKANPANFNFTFYAIKESDFSVLFNLAAGLNNSGTLNYFDLYIKSTDFIFKIEKSVITNTIINFNIQEPISISIEGQGVKLTKESSIPGSIVSRSLTTQYNIVKYTDISVNNTTIERVFSISLELQNDIKWFGHHTIQASSSLMYPNNYSLEKRILSGSIGAYLVDTTFLQTGLLNVPLFLQVGEMNGGTFTGIECDIPLVSVTNRASIQEAYIQYFDWRMLSNPIDLTTVFNYITLE